MQVTYRRMRIPANNCTSPDCIPSLPLSAVLLVGLKPRNISKKDSGLFEGFHDSFCWSFQSFRIQSSYGALFVHVGIHQVGRVRQPSINRGNLFSSDQTNIYFLSYRLAQLAIFSDLKSFSALGPSSNLSDGTYLFVSFCDRSLSHCPKSL